MIKLKSNLDFSMARAIQKCCKHFKLSLGAVKVVSQNTGQEVVSGIAGNYSEQKLIVSQRGKEIRFKCTLLHCSHCTLNSSHCTMHTVN